MRGNLILVLGLTLVLANAFVSGEMANLWATIRGSAAPGSGPAVIAPGGNPAVTQTPDGRVQLPYGFSIGPDGSFHGPLGVPLP